MQTEGAGLHIWGTGSKKLALLTPFLFPAALYEELAKPMMGDYTLYVPDYPGYGALRNASPPYTIPAYAEHVARLLQPYGSMPMLGYSMGGLVAQLLASQHPQMVSSLILASTYAYKAQTLKERLERRLYPSLIRRFGVRAAAYVIHKELVKENPEDRTRLFKLKQLALQTPAEVYAQNAKSLLEIDNRKLLETINLPTLVIHGEKDWVVPKHHAKQVSERIANAELRWVAGAGHFMIYSHNTLFWQEVRAFLSQNEPE